tara:strand:- start:28465 stop:28926 length:462 start_codon:yes stop_codon:yes gene_type:complete
MKQVYRFMIMALAATLVTACSGGDNEEARLERTRILMNEELDPATDGIWLHSGWELTEEGERSLFPETDEEWADVAAAADEVIAVTRKLQSDEYSGGDEEWVAIAESLVVFAGEAKEAAIAHDKEGVFESGGDIYRVCRACHQRYSPGMRQDG